MPGTTAGRPKGRPLQEEARVLAGLLGGFVGDELGYRYARRKLAEEWQAYESERDARHSAPL